MPEVTTSEVTTSESVEVSNPVMGEVRKVLVRTQKMEWRVDVYRRNKWVGSVDRDGTITPEYRQMTYGQALSVFEHLMELKQLNLETETLSLWSSVRITCIVGQKLPTE